jgi:3-(3-hydroxy-phenyl)propionate hydroxylase
VLEAAEQPHPLPRAVHLDHEMMRLFQAAGVIDRVAPHMRETEGHLHVGADSGVIRYMGTVGHRRHFGWANDYFFYQPELETHLRDALAAHPNVTMRLGTSFHALAQDKDGVTLSLVSGGATYEARARWVIGCDGARSSVRRCLGVRLDDFEFEEPWLVVDAEVDGPVRFPALTGVPRDANLQQLSVMMCDPARPATVVPGRGNHRRWEFMLLPGEDDDDMMRPEQVGRLIGPWLDGIPYRLIRAATYRFHGLVAHQWQVGRVFLAGDAAHQTPPFFGQGMCHGLRDVANLAWKLSLVEAGTADQRLLETYQQERNPHVRDIIAAAIAAGRYICVLDPQLAADRDALMRQRQQQGTAATASDLIPAIAGGVVAVGTSGAGERFVQPWIATNQGRALLDDVTGWGWRVFVRDSSLVAQACAAVARLDFSLELTTVDVSKLADDNTLEEWFEHHGARVAIVRPDFYVFGTSADIVGLDALLVKLRERLNVLTHQPRYLETVQ